jgi:hypothetical protein
MTEDFKLILCVMDFTYISLPHFVSFELNEPILNRASIRL